MDYVVAGFGIGAILALVGFALWELFGNVEEPGSSWPSRAAIGLMLAALVIWAVTAVSLVSHIDDATGSRLVLLTSLVALLAVAGGSFWYWRADRALAEANPRPRTVSRQRELSPIAAAPLAGGDIELHEWDSWPERSVGNAADESQATEEKPEPQPTFEPEVAAVAVAAPEVDVEVAVAEVSSTGDEAPDPIAMENDDVGPESDLPDNVRLFRVPAQTAEPVTDDELLAETVDGGAEIDLPETDDPLDDDREAKLAAQAVEDAPEPQPVPPATDDSLEDDRNEGTFESTILADIDGSHADEDGGYRSPLLSDLGSDQLKGVGLAKWRTEARLTGDDDEEPSVSANRGGGR